MTATSFPPRRADAVRTEMMANTASTDPTPTSQRGKRRRLVIDHFTATGRSHSLSQSPGSVQKLPVTLNIRSRRIRSRRADAMAAESPSGRCPIVEIRCPALASMSPLCRDTIWFAGASNVCR